MDMYHSLAHLITLIGEPSHALCVQLLDKNKELIEQARGSNANHQAWEGGYIDHVTEVMNFAVHLFSMMNALRPLPFNLSDALLVLFLNDIEKPWKYSGEPMADKNERRTFREKLIRDSGFCLTSVQENALRYVEGEGDDYLNSRRVMNELAAFCHMCDAASARVWHDREGAKES